MTVALAQESNAGSYSLKWIEPDRTQRFQNNTKLHELYVQLG